jgi:SAM-dependent methyltransferase
MPAPIPKYELRSLEAIRRHYDIERELAERLRAAPAEERRKLYATVYDELFRRVPDHPQGPGVEHAISERVFHQQLGFVKRFLTREMTFLEIGAGDCRLSNALAPQVRRVFAVDVSEEWAGNVRLQPNVEQVLSDGARTPLQDASVDLAYSHQFMEHLHPDDAQEQLRDVLRILVPGGRYICVTPNRLTGPHDVSRYFDDVATGLHLKEYSSGELHGALREAGFPQVSTLVGARGRYVRGPQAPINVLEAFLEAAPSSVRRRLAGWLPMRLLLGVTMVATK